MLILMRQNNYKQTQQNTNNLITIIHLPTAAKYTLPPKIADFAKAVSCVI